MDLTICSIAERPDLADKLGDFPGAWPEFMYHDDMSSLYYAVEATRYAQFCLLAFDRSDPEHPVAKASTVPFHWPHDPEQSLPIGGYDEVIRRAIDDCLTGREGNLVAAVEVAVRVDRRGRGLGRIMLDAMRGNTARLGYPAVIVPVRPNGKHRFPAADIEEYAARRRPDGLPVDPWLRVHLAAGGRMGPVTRRSMTITGTLPQWRDWTGLPFDASGPVIVPEALVPVRCDVEAGYGVYVEPNVWVYHRL